MIILLILIILIITLSLPKLFPEKEKKKPIPFKLLKIQFKDETAYSKLLGTEEWYIFRKHILDLHNHTCDWCGIKERLQIHHKKYQKLPNGKLINPWEYNPKDLMCLCDNCHKRYHNKYKVGVYYISYDNFNKQIKENEANFKTNC